MHCAMPMPLPLQAGRRDDSSGVDRRRADRGDRRWPVRAHRDAYQQRNGSRPRTLSTIAGDLELRIPKLRSGSFFPALLERRRRVINTCLRW